MHGLRVLLFAAFAAGAVHASKVCSRKGYPSSVVPYSPVSSGEAGYSVPLSGPPHTPVSSPAPAPSSHKSPSSAQSPYSAPESQYTPPTYPASSLPPASYSVAPSSASSYSAPSKAYSSASPSSSSHCVNSPTDRQCWGDYNINTDYYETTPDTGVTVTYYLTVDNVTMAPDGVEKEMYVYNGQFPGPLIEANWGDTLVIHVQNNLQTNGTSIHWHGFLQHMNVANDGVPGVTQCPIPPGASFTYTFRATSYGTTWYHSHFSLQYTNGLTGSIIIHGPSSANWDIDTGVLPIMDWYHEPAFRAYYTEIVAPLAADNALFNGLNTFNDSDTIVGQKFEMNFTPGKKHRIRLVNMSTDSHFKFSIDEHVLTVQAADFVAIEPYQTTVLNIFIGQRYDLVVEANQAVGNYWMRLVATAGCSNVINKDLTAIIRYTGADTTADPTSTAYVPPNEICEDETELVPVVVRNAGPFSYGNSMDISIDQNDLNTFGFFRFDINGSSFRIDWSDPTLLLVDNHDPSYPTDYNVLELNGTETTWVYFVVQSTGLFALNHPIHMHGHDFLLLASGTGVFNTSVLKTANLNNPPRRDVITLPASAFGAAEVGGFAVIAFPLDNPGIWMIHCHIAWHVSEGLALEFVERIDEIPGNVGVTAQWQDNCDAWQSYQTAVDPLQDDSGI